MAITYGQLEQKPGGWARTVVVNGKTYRCVMQRGGRVRIAFKPAGTYGWKWYGSVRLVAGNDSRELWHDRVPGSTGVRGMLQAAGVLGPTAAQQQVANQRADDSVRGEISRIARHDWRVELGWDAQYVRQLALDIDRKLYPASTEEEHQAAADRIALAHLAWQQRMRPVAP